MIQLKAAERLILRHTLHGTKISHLKESRKIIFFKSAFFGWICLGSQEGTFWKEKHRQTGIPPNINLLCWLLLATFFWQTI